MTAATLLDHAELNCACFEVFWRLLAPGAVYVKPELTDMMLTSPAPGEGSDGGTQVIALTNFHQLAAKANIMVMPIFGDGHWTLLTAWRPGVQRTETKEEG